MYRPPEFHAWGKTTRVDSPVVVTEKIDGTNGVIFVDPETHNVWAGSRNRWLVGITESGYQMWQSPKMDVAATPAVDNYGFGQYVCDNHQALAHLLGDGHHYGEWWGQGIARGYAQNVKRFQVFDVRHSADPGWDDAAWQAARLGTVPVMYEGPMDHVAIDICSSTLLKRGSVIAPGYMHPEGLVVRFDHNGVRFKKVLDKVGPPKDRPTQAKPFMEKVQWTQEQIEAARAAAAERKAQQ